MRTIRWRAWIGPVATLLAGTIFYLVDRMVVQVPTPGFFLFFVALFSAYVGGAIPGLASAAVAVFFAAVIPTTPDQFLIVPVERNLRLTIYASVLGATSLLIGMAQDRARRAQAKIVAASHDAHVVSAALDNVNFGVLLLDGAMRAQFTNRAFRRMLHYPDRLAETKPAFLDIARDVRGAGVFKLEGADPEARMAKRVAMLRSGDPTPVDLHLVDGGVVRVRCSVLPDEGRMLTYTDMTDEERRSEELESLRSALDQVDYGVMLLDRDLRARFINRAFRKMAEFPDALAEGNPTFDRILQHGRERKAFDMPESEVEPYIARRLAMVREGTKEPIELRWSGGRVVRHQITALPGGGRMLTYTDISDLAKAAEELERLATTDALTGLCNRRQFFALAEREWSRVQRYDRPMALLMFDIDAFKAINDQFGHEIGDNVLVRVAAACNQAKRESDIVARIGGEEFALLLPETDLPSAALFAERLRLACTRLHVLPDRRDLSITVSIGVAEAGPGMRGIEDAMRYADEALYAAKRAGRNRVQCAPQVGLDKPRVGGVSTPFGLADERLARKH